MRQVNMKVKEPRRPRLQLKIALIEAMGSALAFSHAYGIHETKMSKLVRGWRDPTPEELRKFESVFGKQRTKEFFAD